MVVAVTCYPATDFRAAKVPNVPTLPYDPDELMLPMLAGLFYQHDTSFMSHKNSVLASPEWSQAIGAPGTGCMIRFNQ